MSSSTDISRRVLGRNVELLFEVDSDASLAGFMACAHPAEQVEQALHRSSNTEGPADASHVITWTWQEWWELSGSETWSAVAAVVGSSWEAT